MSAAYVPPATRADYADDDLPLAVAGDAAAGKKRVGLPSWAYLAFGVVVLAMVIGALYIAMTGGKPRVAAATVRITENNPPVPPEPAQNATARSTALVPTRPPNQSSRLGPLDDLPVPTKPVAPPPEAASARELAALTTQVQAIDAQLQQLVQMLSAQSPMTRRIIAERVRLATEPAASEPNPAKPKALTYSPLFEVAAIIGNRAWLRRLGDDNGPEVVVGIGDRIAGSHVAEINAADKYVVLDNGQRIR